MDETLPTPCGALVIRPGDTLIVRFQKPMSMDHADRVKKGLEELLPGVADVVLIVADQIAVYRPGDAP